MINRNSERRIAQGVFTTTLCLFLAMVLMAGCKPSEADLQESRHQIVMVLQIADYDFGQSVSIVESTDENGKPCLVGVLSDELDAALGDLVDTYNADPSTTKPITVEEARNCLTEDIVAATSRENKESPFWSFLYWTDDPAELVYRENRLDSNGNIVQGAGDPVASNTITNYDFLTETGDVFSNYKFIWE